MKLFDVHTHIQDDRVRDIRAAIMARAMAAGVDRIMVCGLHEQDWDQVLAMAHDHDCLVPSLGIHPWFIQGRSVSWAEVLRKKLETHGAAVGEIGLDRMIPDRDDQDQEQVFVTQLNIARDLGRPVNIHCRSAWGRMADILKERGGLPQGGIIHSWSGSADMVRVFEGFGASISFSGSVTRPDNKKVRKAVCSVSRDRLVLETDSPDILPTGVNAMLNEPAFVRVVLESVAFLRHESVDEVAAYTYDNAMRIFSACENVHAPKELHGME
ncbi:MAG: TatD family hydrolase [Proteobacteria bacterium]|nr:TatD family hydrolase [Pseudomonadota bacterium]